MGHLKLLFVVVVMSVFFIMSGGANAQQQPAGAVRVFQTDPPLRAPRIPQNTAPPRVHPYLPNWGLPYKVTHIAQINISIFKSGNTSSSNPNGGGAEQQQQQHPPPQHAVMAGTLNIALYGDEVPRVVQNFAALANGDKGFGYNGTVFHRLVHNFILQGGDIENKKGFGGYSIFNDNKGSTFEPDNYNLRHQEGSVAMAAEGKSVGSQFYVLLADTAPYLDTRHCVFGQVISGFRDFLHRIDRTTVDESEEPLGHTIVITGCQAAKVVVATDEDGGGGDEQRSRGGAEASDKDFIFPGGTDGGDTTTTAQPRPEGPRLHKRHAQMLHGNTQAPHMRKHTDKLNRKRERAMERDRHEDRKLKDGGGNAANQDEESKKRDLYHRRMEKRKHIENLRRRGGNSDKDKDNKDGNSEPKLKVHSEEHRMREEVSKQQQQQSGNAPASSQQHQRHHRPQQKQNSFGGGKRSAEKHKEAMRRRQNKQQDQAQQKQQQQQEQL